MLSSETKPYKTIIYLLLIFTGVVILRNAWVGDDSYIGFRTVYNFTHGYGLTFNIHERVQSFTNPLWIFVMSFFYLFTGEAYFTSILLSLVITLFTIYCLTVKFSDGILMTLIIFGLAVTSKAFMDYSTSGLENPLGHLFVVLFSYVYLSEIRHERKLFLLFLIAAFAAVNRLDNLLLYLVPLLSEFKNISKRNFLIMTAGFLPLIIWEVFSILYYGFPFPNTYYAKLTTGIPASEYMIQGVRYFINSLNLDPITLFIITTAIACTLVYSYRNKKYKLILLVLSVLLYLFYVVKVGGDFMTGRFFTYPFLLSIIILTQIELSGAARKLLLVLIILINIISPYSPVKSDGSYRRNELSYSQIVINGGVADERAWYLPSTGLMNLSSKSSTILGVEKSLDTTRTYRDSITAFIEAPLVLGFPSYSAGPNVYIFHWMGLSDPLIARLPSSVTAEEDLRIGHFDRKIPDGYIETLKTGRNQMTDKNLAMFYEKLSIIIRGDIFSGERFSTIYKMNTGQYDYLIDRKFYGGRK
jgi:arabinofuranosyltransferase